MDQIKKLLIDWIDRTSNGRVLFNRLVFRLKVVAGLAVALFVAWHGFLFYLDRPIEHAVQIEISKPSEVTSAPEVILGDNSTTPIAGAKPSPIQEIRVAKETRNAAETSDVPAASVAAETPVSPSAPQSVKLKVHVQAKAKFPKGINSKKALEFFKRKIEGDNPCFTQSVGAPKQLTALVKTSATGAVLAVTLKPVATKEKRKVASVVKEWTPTSVCLKKYLDKTPALRTKGQKPSISEIILKFE